MGLIFNRPDQKPRRRYLRSHMTKAEVILWSSLKGRGVLGEKFRRQQGVEVFVLDFYCPSLRLAIELDGESHDSPEAQKYDRERQERLERGGIRFLRFRNEEVLGDPDKVVARIAREIRLLRAL
jgi:very-short-patch-repair endonuclease